MHGNPCVQNAFIFRVPNLDAAGRSGPGRRYVNRTQAQRGGWSWWYLLFAVQYVAVLWPPFYNKAEPSWIGIPFFYWYQLLWVLIGAVFTAVVYFTTED
jgi:hypothetical protein